MAEAVAITRRDLSAAELRREAARSRDAAAARRMLAVALVLDGHSRTAAAEACGMRRQTLRDRVHRYNVEGIAGRAFEPPPPGPGAAPLGRAGGGAGARWGGEGPDLERDGVVRWRCADPRDRIGSTAPDA